MGRVTEASHPENDVVMGVYPVALNQWRLIAKTMTRPRATRSRGCEADHGDELHESVDPAAAPRGQDAEDDGEDRGDEDRPDDDRERDRKARGEAHGDVLPLNQDRPRLPLTAWTSQSPYWAMSGRSRPSSEAFLATVSAEAF